MPSPFESILEEPDFYQGLYGERVGNLRTPNQREYYKDLFKETFDPYKVELGRMFDKAVKENPDVTSDNFQESLGNTSFQDYLGRQDFQGQFRGLTPAQSGRQTGKFNPFARFNFQ